MICSICNKQKLQGTVQGGQFVCTGCELSKMAKKILKKPVNKDWQIIDVLKSYGIPGSAAKGYYENKTISTEHLIKQVWLFRYLEEERRYHVKSRVGLMRGLIKNLNEYHLSDAFREWYKEQLNNHREGDFDILYRSI